MVFEVIKKILQECSPDEVYYFDREILYPDAYMGEIVIWGVMINQGYVYVEINAGEWLRLQGNEDYLDCILSKLLAYKQWILCFNCN